MGVTAHKAKQPLTHTHTRRRRQNETQHVPRPRARCVGAMPSTSRRDDEAYLAGECVIERPGATTTTGRDVCCVENASDGKSGFRLRAFSMIEEEDARDRMTWMVGLVWKV